MSTREPSRCARPSHFFPSFLARFRPQEWDKIWAINKKVIDPVCPRHTAVETACRVTVTLAGGPSPPKAVDVPRHLKHPPAGTKRQLRGQQLWLDQASGTAGRGPRSQTL